MERNLYFSEVMDIEVFKSISDKYLVYDPLLILDECTDKISFIFGYKKIFEEIKKATNDGLTVFYLLYTEDASVMINKFEGLEPKLFTYHLVAEEDSIEAASSKKLFESIKFVK